MKIFEKRPMRHCERSEAIQYYLNAKILDCFVVSLLAMTFSNTFL